VRTHSLRPVSGPGRVPWAGLLAVLLALILPTAATTTATVTTVPAATAIAAVAADDRTAAGGDACRPGSGERDGTTVRVVKKVRGVLAPHVVLDQPVAPAGTELPRPVSLPDRAVPHTAVAVHTHPRRGPPVADDRPGPDRRQTHL
jgi:hypothetical protein